MKRKDQASDRGFGLHARFSLALLFLLAACAPVAGGPFRDYYVSTTGNDATGNGSLARPWLTVQHALDSADYSGERVHIHIAAGEYNENLVITRPVLITGAGSGDPIGGGSPTVIRPDTTGISQGDPLHRISGGTQVELRDLTFYYGRVEAIGGSLVVENVWFYWISGLYGLRMQDVGAFSVINSDFRTGTRIFADLGIWVVNSTGDILGGYFGDYLDHPIDIARHPGGLLTFVNVDGVTVRGSTICYADGIRVSGGAIVNIQNSDIRRMHADAESWSGCRHGDMIAAGVDFNRPTLEGGVANSMVLSNVISGFDVGIGIDVRRSRIKFEGNDISGVTHGVRVWRWPSATSSTGAQADFGRGPLGSIGGNTFRNVGAYAIYLDEDYNVSACDNEWEVPETQIDPDRIYDNLDDSTLGRVTWFCLREPIIVGPTETLPVIYTFTPDTSPDATITTNARCRTGPGPVYGDYDFFNAGDQTEVHARSSDSNWYYVQALNLSGKCWIGQAVLQFDVSSDVLLALPVLQPPPTPTFTPDAGQGDGTGEGGSAPAAPSGLQSSTLCASPNYHVDLSWNDNANNEQGYRVYRNGQAIATLNANTTKYTDTTPPGNGPQKYYVQAFNGAGTANSNEVKDAGCMF